MAGNLTLTKLLYLLSQAEKEQGKEDFSKLITACYQEWQALVTLLEEQEQVNTDKTPSQAVSISVFLNHIEALQNQAEHAEIDDELLSDVQNNAPVEYKDAVAEIVGHFDNFDFDAASTALANLKHRIAAD